jgi:hypothetical protein
MIGGNGDKDPPLHHPSFVGNQSIKGGFPGAGLTRGIATGAISRVQYRHRCHGHLCKRHESPAARRQAPVVWP